MGPLPLLGAEHISNGPAPRSAGDRAGCGIGFQTEPLPGAESVWSVRRRRDYHVQARSDGPVPDGQGASVRVVRPGGTGWFLRPLARVEGPALRPRKPAALGLGRAAGEKVTTPREL